MAKNCETCRVPGLQGQGDRDPMSVASSTAFHMWRRDLRGGESIDDQGYRRYISIEAGVTLEEAEVIWNCALSQYRGKCNLTVE